MEFILLKEPATILDVASGPSGITSFIDGTNVTLLDVVFNSAPRGHVVVIGSMVELPFAGNSYDLVISCHGVEHLPDHLRSSAVAEMLRVARRWVLVSCPTGHYAERADLDLAEWFRKKRKPVPYWLEEHLHAGLPDLFKLGESQGGRKRTGYNMSVELNNRVVRLESKRLLQILSAMVAEIAPRFADCVLRRMLASEKYYDGVLIISKEEPAEGVSR